MPALWSAKGPPWAACCCWLRTRSGLRDRSRDNDRRRRRSTMLGQEPPITNTMDERTVGTPRTARPPRGGAGAHGARRSALVFSQHSCPRASAARPTAERAHCAGKKRKADAPFFFCTQTFPPLDWRCATERTLATRHPLTLFWICSCDTTCPTW